MFQKYFKHSHNAETLLIYFCILLSHPCTRLSSQSVLSSFFLFPRFNLSSFLSAKTTAISLRTCSLSALCLLFLSTLLSSSSSPSYLAFILNYGPTLSPLLTSFHLLILLFISFTLSPPPFPIVFIVCPLLTSLLIFLFLHLSSCLPSPIPPLIFQPFCSSELGITHSCMLPCPLSICFPSFSVSPISFHWPFFASWFPFLNRLTPFLFLCPLSSSPIPLKAQMVAIFLKAPNHPFNISLCS